MAAKGKIAGTGGSSRKGPSHVSKARILLVDDHPLMRLAVRNIIRLERDLEVCGEASNGARHQQDTRGTAHQIESSPGRSAR